MSKLDVTKEEIGYLKLWLGIAVITDISLVSWFVTRANRAGVLLAATAVVAAAAITIFVLSVHKRNAKRIQDLEDL